MGSPQRTHSSHHSHVAVSDIEHCATDLKHPINSHGGDLKLKPCDGNANIGAGRYLTHKEHELVRGRKIEREANDHILRHPNTLHIELKAPG